MLGVGLARLSIGLALLGGAVAGCDDDGSAARPSTPPALDQLRIVGAHKTSCPSALTRSPAASTCKIAVMGIKLSPCSARTGGFDVQVAGISCEDARDLLLPLGASIGRYNRPKQVIYQPWTARGPLSLSDLDPSKPTGWTCWAGFDPKLGEIWHTCWRGSDLLMFKTA